MAAASDIDRYSQKEPFIGPRSVSRASATYAVHSYHTKVPVEAIVPYLNHYTEPGDVVLDPFAGSGMTGVAASLAGRRAVLNDLSPAAAHIARNYTTPCDPSAFQRAAERLLSWAVPQIEPVYAAPCSHCSRAAKTEYVIWADLRTCPRCGGEVNVWTSRSRGTDTVSVLNCQHCNHSFRKNQARVAGEVPVVLNLSCPSCRPQRFERAPTTDDLIACHWDDRIPYWIPDILFGPDRLMWRGGHRDLGITNVAHFWSRRNLFALAVLWEGISREPGERVREALRFVFTAIVNRASRRYQWNEKRPTNVLGGTLYIASLRYEFNVLSLFARKLHAVNNYYRSVPLREGMVSVHEGSATDLSFIPEDSVDYCFTDPPFGANIYYADCSILWESWLGKLTDQQLEAVVAGRRPGKSVMDYRRVMAESLEQVARRLKKGAWVSMIFQNTDQKVWNALREAALDAGFRIVNTATLHKSQPSFKGIKASVNGERVAATDVVLTLAKLRQTAVTSAYETKQVVVDAIEAELAAGPESGGRLRSTAHLYAVAMSALIRRNCDTSDWTFDRIEDLLQENFECRIGGWFLKEVSVAAV